MKKLGHMLSYGASCWFIVFGASLAMTPWRMHERALFESVIPVVLAATTVALALRFFRRAAPRSIAAGASCGVVWATVNVALDLPLFSWGPMKMAPADYFKDIGIVYAMIPVITTGLVAMRGAGANASTSSTHAAG
jgi:hypothetical protein